MDSNSAGGGLGPPKRRAAPRFDLRAPVEYHSATSNGEGTVWNISTSGARVENVSAFVELGARLGLRASFYPGSFDTVLSGEVVRHTEAGFAVQFVDLGSPQKALLASALPGTQPMNARPQVEVFSAGCPACEETVQLVRELASPSCEVSVLDMNEPAVAQRARQLGIRSVPAVAIDGTLADCCAGRGPDAEVLRAAGLGQPLE